VDNSDRRPWYADVTRYQWLVLLIASLGWVFDIFEGQIFVASMNEAMPQLVEPGTSEGVIASYKTWSLVSFLLGGALGGVVFGILSDRIGRTTTMILTILMYSLFTFASAFSQTWWQMAALRFLVALGVGGEWAVASAMVAEVFSERARAWSGAIFHASSVFGTYLAIVAGVAIGYFMTQYPQAWRYGFAIGVVPALLTLFIRWKLREPEKWVEARLAAKQDQRRRTGRLSELFGPEHFRATFVGVSLAAIGLATFWGVHIYGKNVMLDNAVRYTEAQVEALNQRMSDAEPAERERAVAKLRKERESPNKYAEMLGMFLVTTGGGLGLVSFGPLCQWIGRRWAFLLFHVGGLAAALALFQPLFHAEFAVLCLALPVFGFLTLGMHAGYAIYFPELYPTRLRGTGGGFCFNVGRVIAAPILFGSGWMLRGVEWNYASGWIQATVKSQPLTLQTTATVLSLLFLLALLVLAFAPETKGQALQK
jgi:MFS family permease